VGQVIDEAIEHAPVLDDLSKKVTSAITSVENTNNITRTIEDVLHGKWLGHPLHPVLTDVTIGAWLSAAILDIASVVMGSDEVEDAADVLTGIGTASGVATAVTGLTDYSRIKRDAARHGLIHGLLNAAALTSYTVSSAARRAGNRKLGLAASMTGLGIATLSAWIGGDMVYRFKVGVNHAQKPSGLDEWRAVMPNDDLLEQQAQRVEVNGMAILLYRRYGAIYAIGAVCSHAGGPLDEGKFDEFCVECPWHQSVFDVRDGSVVHGPANVKQPEFETRIANEQIEVRVRPEKRQ
jgi:nitrite reductase/ring-hydroxylating ferredoxin subunit/uncharacterized membrane protein